MISDSTVYCSTLRSEVSEVTNTSRIAVFAAYFLPVTESYLLASYPICELETTLLYTGISRERRKLVKEAVKFITESRYIK